MVLRYQPVLDLRTGAVVKFEALARPSEGDGDIVAAVAVAQREGTLRRFTSIIFELAFSEWQQFAPPDVGLSINLALENLLEADLPRRIERACRKFHLEPNRVWFEVGDRAQVVSDLRMIETMRELTAIGVRFSIDSFGDDYTQATLYEVDSLPARELKIDGRLVNDADSNMMHRSIITATVALAQQLHLDVCAKGVERENVAALVARLGCTHAQGYYFHRPVEGALVAAVVAANRSVNTIED